MVEHTDALLFGFSQNVEYEPLAAQVNQPRESSASERDPAAFYKTSDTLSQSRSVIGIIIIICIVIITCCLGLQDPASATPAADTTQTALPTSQAPTRISATLAAFPGTKSSSLIRFTGECCRSPRILMLPESFSINHKGDSGPKRNRQRGSWGNS